MNFNQTNMIRSIKSFILILALVAVFSCSKTDIDDKVPVIDMSFAGAFPQNCDTVYIGESFILRALFTDNVALGQYNVDIHHNFQHHAHSTDFVECEMDPQKTAVNPFLLIKTFEIPENIREFYTAAEIFVFLADLRIKISRRFSQINTQSFADFFEAKICETQREPFF
jgi:hypothetical protein